MVYRAFPAVVLAASFAAAALADVSIVSRRSETAQARFDGGPTSESDSDFYTGLGAWDSVLSLGLQHHSSATNQAINGAFSGSASFHPAAGSATASNSIVATFDVTGLNMRAEIAFIGSVFPSYSRANVMLTIRNVDTGVTVFDIYRDGTLLVDRDVNTSYWNQQSVSVALAAGRYQLSATANGSDQEQMGGGQGSQGGGAINFTATFVPTPTTTAAVLLGLVTLRRRR